ncbi:Fur-regulated basic protein FbpA [Alkalihalobacillus sp. BA299]|uniref:Fur-regulated basic protein FbpA n=1 Tax=Alkalihalobacillus sp. BA299 TaxID=2815938 RepID=UPI001ADB0067|nr:Fur-regulated basic protein FbpA [Alkalihalobacillus sp. BA299]
MSNCTKNERKEKMIHSLIELGIYKRNDGKQLYELSEDELEIEIKNVVDLIRNHYGINRKTS